METLSSFFRSDKGRKRRPYGKRDDKITAKGLGNSFLAGAGLGGTLGGIGQAITQESGTIGKYFHPSKNYGRIVLGSGLVGIGLHTGKKLYNKIQNRNNTQN
jgi:hypothetical protein